MKLEKNESAFPRFRNWVQLGIFVTTVGIGIQFYLYVRQAFQGEPFTISRPPGVEGFLPIGGLLAWKNFFVTGQWDPVHPAAMVILGFACILSFGLRKSFCGWFCPIGTLSEWLGKIGKQILGKNYQFPFWLDLPLRSLKYILLGFFFWVIFFSMDMSATKNFLQSPYYKMADVKMLHFFTQMSDTTAIVLAILIICSLFIFNFWCRYLCPYGALMGLLSLFGPTSIYREEKSCIECQRCSQICPYYLPIHKNSRIKSPECNGCLECTLSCPVKNTLRLKTIGFKKFYWTPIRLGLLIIGSFVLLKYGAEITGHWKSEITEVEFRIRLYEMMVEYSAYQHPQIEKNKSGGFQR